MALVSELFHVLFDVLGVVLRIVLALHEFFFFRRCSFIDTCLNLVFLRLSASFPPQNIGRTVQGKK